MLLHEYFFVRYTYTSTHQPSILSNQVTNLLDGSAASIEIAFSRQNQNHIVNVGGRTLLLFSTSLSSNIPSLFKKSDRAVRNQLGFTVMLGIFCLSSMLFVLPNSSGRYDGSMTSAYAVLQSSMDSKRGTKFHSKLCSSNTDENCR